MKIIMEFVYNLLMENSLMLINYTHSLGAHFVSLVFNQDGCKNSIHLIKFIFHYAKEHQFVRRKAFILKMIKE